MRSLGTARAVDIARHNVKCPTQGTCISIETFAGARAALSEAHRHSLSEFVIEWNGKQVGSIKTGFRKAVKAAGLSDVTPHVLRHTAAVHLAAAGVPMQKIAQYLGHSSTSITESVYARYAPDHLREESNILDFTRIKQVQ